MEITGSDWLLIDPPSNAALGLTTYTIYSFNSADQLVHEDTFEVMVNDVCSGATLSISPSMIANYNAEYEIAGA